MRALLEFITPNGSRAHSAAAPVTWSDYERGQVATVRRRYATNGVNIDCVRHLYAPMKSFLPISVVAQHAVRRGDMEEKLRQPARHKVGLADDAAFLRRAGAQ